MSDSDILVTTRYTTEGYDQALNRADRVGQTMLKLSRDIGSLGRAFNSEFLTGIGNALGGVEDMIGAVSELSKSIKAVPALGFGVAGVAGIGVGSAIYDAIIGKLQGTNTDTILKQIGELIRVGFNTDTLRVEAQVAQVNSMTMENSKFTYDPNNIASLNKQLAGTGVSVSGGDVTSLKKSIEETQKLLDLRLTEGDVVGSTVAQVSTALNILKQALKDAEAANQSANLKRFNQMFDPIENKIKAATEYQNKLASASQTYHAAEMDRAKELAQLNAEISSRRIQAAQSLASDLSRMDDAYYANRLKAAESFGLESQRAEEDHQRDMRRLSQEHDKRMSKLADSRDALGLADEVSNYEDQRKASEEDYSVAQSRRNQDFAIQMRDMEKAFQQQRQERINAYNQQLQDIAVYNVKQREMIAAQFRDIAAAVLKAFTDAAKQYTASNNTSTTTTTNQSMTQTNNFGGVSNPSQIASIVNAQVAEIFRAARK